MNPIEITSSNMLQQKTAISVCLAITKDLMQTPWKVSKKAIHSNTDFNEHVASAYGALERGCLSFQTNPSPRPSQGTGGLI